MKKPLDPIKRTKSGVFLVTASGQQKIAAPIWFKAIGHRVADSTEIAEISFVTRKGKTRAEYFKMAATLPRNRHRVIEKLANRDYRWPSGRGLPDRIIEEVIADEPDQFFKLVGAPGWYGGTILTSRR